MQWWDAVIVGSGFGASVAALRLAETGATEAPKPLPTMTASHHCTGRPYV